VIALDTNVLVRFLVDDDKAQAEKAARLIERASRAGDALFVSDVVLCEVVWVLAASYRVPRPTIVATLQRLLHAKHLAFRAPDELAHALDAFSKGKGDFADYVIREHGRAAGCNEVATFDRALLKEAGFISP
jgi:predicted nucleic-acid-binding protein